MQPDSHNSYPSGNTQSIWMGTTEVPDYPPLRSHVTTDVCVIGAGWAGLTTAYHLLKAGKRVVVLDDGPVGGGESGRTTAHLTAAMDDGIAVLEKTFGEKGARLVVESHLAAINRMEEIAKLEGIDCDFERVDGWLFLGEGDSRDTLERELAAARRAGFADASLAERAPIATWESGPALRFPNQAQLHALKYLAGLAAAVVRLGGTIHGGSHVSAVNGGSPCRVETDSKHTVTASAVCVCTNSPITDMVETHTKMAPYRTFAIAAVIPRGMATKALFWDTADPYHYVRVQALDEPYPGVLKGDTLYDALIVGGEDHKTGHKDDAVARWERLERWARARWPQMQEVVYTWSGQVLEPVDYIAMIGPNPDGAENVYIATGDSGQGTTHGTIAGMLLTDLVLGRDNPWAELYAPKRVTLRAGPLEGFARENADVAVQFVKDWLKPSEAPAESDIPRGEGRVMRHGAHKVAVYRDDSGTLHSRSAVCTHLKCIVAWNSAEKSWDCPCHGSRFDPLGKVLNGPALSDLEPLDG